LHPSKTGSTIEHGTFSLIGMKASPLAITAEGNPPAIESNGEASLVNLGTIPLTNITYTVLGLDTMLTAVDIIHPDVLLPGILIQ
jgi:hypothetical protein